MARRAFLHIGTPKSGTTYLQSLWWRHRVELERRGLLLPGGSLDAQFQATASVRGNAGVLASIGPQRAERAWESLVAEVADAPGDVLVSQEQLVEADAEHAARAVGDLASAASEVHLVVTMRDLARQIPSAWQQRVRHGSDTTLERFCRRVAKDDPGFNFWRHHDVPRVLERWAPGLPPDRVHVVALPRPGRPTGELWGRVCGLLGVDPAGLSVSTPDSNEALHPEEIELLRRVNAHFPRAHHDLVTSRRLKRFFDPLVGGADARPPRLLMSEEMHGWAVERGTRMSEELAAGGWHVVGDLDDLRPDPDRGPGVDPDAVGDDAVAQAAVSLLVDLVEAATEETERAAQPEPDEPAPVRRKVNRLVARLRLD